MTRPKLIIWKCAGDCCFTSSSRLLWHAGTIKHKPFLSTIRHELALDFFRWDWSS